VSEDTVTVSLENIAAGHDWPSCSKDRRAWVEVVATDADGTVLFQTGVVDDDTPIAELDQEDLWWFGDTLRNEEGETVLMHWESWEVDTEALPALGLSGESTHVTRTFTVPDGEIAEVQLRLNFRPMALDVLDDLVASGDLDPDIKALAPTFRLEAPTLVWTKEDQECLP
jgi:hypothetical protein